MNERERAILTIAARLTGYPAASFREELDELEAFAGAMLEGDPAQQEILNAINGLIGLSVREAQERYVAAFDLKDRTGLYLTAHEMGDSRQRGVMLIELREMIGDCGFEPPAGELADYMPMLYEFAAVVDESDSLRRLIERLAFATQRILNHLPEDNPFEPIFRILMQHVLEAPSDEVMQERERNREKPDLDPMPYPLMYK